MKPIVTLLEERLTGAMRKATGLENCAALLKGTADPKFGDYQANGVMAVAKQIKTNPRQLAEKVVGQLDVSDMCEQPEVAGPGFINLRLKPEFIAQRLLEINADVEMSNHGHATLRPCHPERLGISKTQEPKTIVVDFSGPNIAKQMHVGHLRSTIIGDAICRLLEFQGHNVIHQNHIGDWGTQFGMLIAYLKKLHPTILSNPASAHIADLEQFYKNAKQLCDADPLFADEARKEVVNLHNHNAETLKVWRHIVDESRNHYQPIYDILGADLHQKNERGESFYSDKLQGVVD
ncbi:MAG: arginine--tRNA ligase, partial [Sedimentisphaerales bacterium]|nr:arginine--tRNA ligase [Sedimentisphaerales bacterium]